MQFIKIFSQITMSFPSSASCAVDQILTRMTAYNCFIVSHCIVLYHRLVKTRKINTRPASIDTQLGLSHTCFETTNKTVTSSLIRLHHGRQTPRRVNNLINRRQPVTRRLDVDYWPALQRQRHYAQTGKVDSRSLDAGIRTKLHKHSAKFVERLRKS